MSRHAPVVVILTVAAAALSIAALLGGPRIGYLPGIVVSTLVVLVIVWRYDPPLRIQWLGALLLAAYHGGGTLMVGSDVLAHVSAWGSVLRYDRGLHVFGGVVAVLLVVVIADRSRPVGSAAILAMALGAGFAVEAVELFTALVAPGVFSYDVYDSSLDVAGNIAGLVVGFSVLAWTDIRRADERAGTVTGAEVWEDSSVHIGGLRPR